MLREIKAYRTSEGWVARFMDDGETRELFGTDVLPMPFTARAPLSLVMDALAKANRGIFIEARDSDGTIVRLACQV